MTRALVLAVCLVAFSSASALAEQAGDPGTNVEMPFLIAPMTKEGKLLGYAYISSHLQATSSSAALEIREKMAFIQDAFVRDVNTTPVGLVTDPTKVDTRVLSTRLVNDAKRILGGAKVASIVFGDGKKDTGIQFSPLHPSQMPALPPETVAELGVEAVPAKPAPKHHE